MARKYLIVPSDYSPDYMNPSKLEELHKTGPTEHNADIVIVENGIEKSRFLYRDSLRRKLGATLPEVPVRTHTVEGEVKEEVLKEEELPDIRKGCPPILQVIYDNSSWIDGAEKEELVKIIDSSGWFEGMNLDIGKMVEIGSRNLIEKDLLTVSDNKYHAGPKELESYFDLGKDGHELDGPYPPMRLAREKASERGARKIVDLVDIIFDDWNYTLKRESAWNWIEKCIDNGYLRKVDENTVEPFRSLKES